jgi:sphinganine-1-phosphate aldolase
MGEHCFPATGRSAGDLLDEVAAERGGDLNWRGGRAFSLVYHPDDPELEELQHRMAVEFLHENALNPFRYQTLLRMEGELVDMACDLFGAQRGALTSGGTESIFLAVQTARDAARERGITSPELVCANTAHPAFAKACHYLDVRRVAVPVGDDGRAVPGAMADVIGPDTALVVASAPCYPYGVIDPVEEIAALASARGVPCHVDACLGGWLLPFWERLGRPVPPWDLRVDGVTSLSADVHKYGYATKGVSTLVYADPSLYRHQVFMYDEWPGGLYASASTAGTRGGAPIAIGWATVVHLGAEGYLRLARRVAAATDRIRSGIAGIEGLRVTGDPVASVFEFGVDPTAADPPDLAVVGDRMDDRGWNLDRQQGGLHLMLSPGHDAVADAFVDDLAAAVGSARGVGAGTARSGDHVYGGVVGDA